MPRNYTKKFFVKDGKPLSTADVDFIQPTYIPREAISTLSNVVPTKKEVLFGKFMDFRSGAKNVFSLEFFKAYSGIGVSAVAVSLFLLASVFNTPLLKVSAKAPDRYALFSATPLTLDDVNQNLSYKDSRAAKVDSVFKTFNCPLYGYGSKFVEEADKNDLPYWLVVSIAFQESSCGKNTPSIDGAESYNAWGWATYGDQVFGFKDWNEGIEVVSKYMSKRFFSRDITDLCEIMKTYTPPSNGSWCRGVGYFRDFILNYKTPTE